MTAPTYGSATADSGVGPQPSNGIVVSGEPAVQYLHIETVANMYPGRLVTKGTTDRDIAVCGAGGKAIGVLGYEHAAKKYRPETRDTIYKVLDEAPVLSQGKGAIVLLYLAQSQTVVKGDKLVAAAVGMVSLAPAAAPPSGTVAVVSTAQQPTAAGPIPTSGPIVAQAEESVTTTNAEGFIMASLER